MLRKSLLQSFFVYGSAQRFLEMLNSGVSHVTLSFWIKDGFYYLSMKHQGIQTQRKHTQLLASQDAHRAGPEISEVRGETRTRVFNTNLK